MPLPFIIAAGAAIAGAAGLGAGIHGAVKMKEANDTVKSAQQRNEENAARLENSNNKTATTMDKLGKYEQEIMSSFKRFSDAYEKLKNRPDIAEIHKDENLPCFTLQELKDAAIGANILLGGLGGAGLGTAGAFAAAGGVTSAIMALGTASTGTAISTLSGAAATNATLAALGGGSLAVGGGGIALGTAILGGATLGVGLLIGGIIFSVAGSSVSDNADKAWNQMIENEKKINSICDHLDKLKIVAKSFHDTLSVVNNLYIDYLVKLEQIIEERKRNVLYLYEPYPEKVDYKKFSDEQKRITENTILLVHLLYEMCKVQLVKKTENDDALNKINEEAIIHQIEQSEEALSKIDSVA